MKVQRTVVFVLLTIFALLLILLYVQYHVCEEHFDCGHIAQITAGGCGFLPDILIVGFDKCGTMTLRQFLNVHPDIFITSRSANIRYFETQTNRSATGIPDRIECTPEGKLRLDKLAHPDYPENVHKCASDVKLIVMVKEPTERAMSSFVHLLVQHGTHLSINDFDTCMRKIVNFLKLSDVLPARNHPICGDEHIINSITTSMYVTTLKPWVDVFGLKNILIIDGDNFVANPVQELRKAEQFLGLEQKIMDSDFYYDKIKKFYCIQEEGMSGCMSEKKGRPHPAMTNSTRKLLKDFFRPYNEEFYKLIGRTFPWDD